MKKEKNDHEIFVMVREMAGTYYNETEKKDLQKPVKSNSVLLQVILKSKHMMSSLYFIIIIIIILLLLLLLLLLVRRYLKFCARCDTLSRGFSRQSLENQKPNKVNKG